MNPFYTDPDSATAEPAVDGNTVGRGRGQDTDDNVVGGYRNLTVRDIVKELATVASSYADNNNNIDYDYDYNSSDYKPVSARVETFVMAAILGLIFIVGVLGNGTLIAIFLRHRGMRNIPNT